MLIQSLPHQIDENSIRQIFLARVTPNMTEDDKATLQAEYQAAREQALKSLDKQREAVAKANTQCFLDNPEAVLQELDDQRGRTFDLGELLIWNGIASVSLKRNGKGFLIGKGSDYAHTVSPFVATIKIGPHTFVMDTGCANDRRSKDDAKATTASLSAKWYAKHKPAIQKEPFHLA